MNLNKTQTPLRQLLRWMWRASVGIRWRVALISVVGLAKVAVSLAFVWVSKILIDAATLPSTPASTLWQWAALLIASLIAEMALSQWSNYLSSVTSTRLALRMRHNLYHQLLHSDLYSQRRHTGDLLNRVLVDVDAVAGMLVDFIPSLLMMVAQLLAACLLLLMMNPSLMLCALVITPFCVVVSNVFFGRVRRLNGEVRAMESQVQTHLQEGLQHRLVVQTLECAPLMMQRFDHLQESLFRKTLSRLYVGIYSRVMMRMGFMAGYLIAFIWSAFELHAGTITFGVMTAFLQLVSRIQTPISTIAGMVPSVMKSVTAADRLIEVEREGGAPAPAAPRLQGPVGIRLKDVTFRYEKEGQPVLQHFNHDFTPGSRTAVMGETGVGKSTLAKLILALLHPEEGSMELYQEGQSMPLSAATRGCMTFVPQGNSLLAGTVRDNLLLGNPSATEEQMREALRIAVAEFVFALPMGLDTPCGELGSQLSEGQCQRIAIARALMHDAAVLIFDEMYSALDNATANTLRQRLFEARPHCTMILISHKPEVAEMCDNTLLL